MDEVGNVADILNTAHRNWIRKFPDTKNTGSANYTHWSINEVERKQSHPTRTSEKLGKIQLQTS